MSQSLGDEPKRVCVGCVGDDFLQKTIALMTLGECSYCNEIYSPRIAIEDLAKLVEAGIQRHYEQTPTDPEGYEYVLHNDPEIEYEWEREGDPIADVISDTVGCDDVIASEILEILSEKYDYYDPRDGYDAESEFSSESHYERRKADSGNWAEMWNRLQHALKHESRLFNQEALEILSSVFAGLDGSPSRSDGAAVVTAGPGSEGQFPALYRAREFQSSEALRLCT